MCDHIPHRPVATVVCWVTIITLPVAQGLPEHDQNRTCAACVCQLPGCGGCRPRTRRTSRTRPWWTGPRCPPLPPDLDAISTLFALAAVIVVIATFHIQPQPAYVWSSLRSHCRQRARRRRGDHRRRHCRHHRHRRKQHQSKIGMFVAVACIIASGFVVNVAYRRLCHQRIIIVIIPVIATITWSSDLPCVFVAQFVFDWTPLQLVLERMSICRGNIIAECGH